ncbi:MAG TPA: hypothetical protein VI318_19095 [Baekduia sp.]
MSRLAIMLTGALLGALLLTATASAGVSKHCRLISRTDIGSPVGMSHLRLSGTTVANPSLTGAKGRLALCDFSDATVGTVASTSIATLGSPTAARKEFSAQIHKARRTMKTRKLAEPFWNDGYYLGKDGILVLKGRYIFHLQYASGLKRFSQVTVPVLTILSAKAVNKL